MNLTKELKLWNIKNTIDFMNVLNSFTLDIPRLITNAKPIIIEGSQIVSKNQLKIHSLEI